MGDGGLNVSSIDLSTDSPSWPYDSRVGLAFSYCLCITMVNTACYLHNSNYTVTLLMFNNSLLFNGEVCYPNLN